MSSLVVLSSWTYVLQKLRLEATGSWGSLPSSEPPTKAKEDHNMLLFPSFRNDIMCLHMICFWFNTPRRLKAIEIVLSGPGISVKIPKIIGLFLPDQSLGHDHQVTANPSVQLGGLPCVHDWLCHPQRWKISSVDLTALPRLHVTEIDKRIGHWTQFQKPSCAFGYGSKYL
jgi:hypothetical protein